MFKLYEISNQYQKAIDGLLANQESSQLVIEEIKDSFDNKIIATAKYLKNIEAEYQAVKSSINLMNERANKLADEMKFLEIYMQNNIEKTGLLDEIKCSEFVVKVQNNPASLEIDKPELIPDIYKVKKEIISFDKNAMKKDIKDGFDIDGARLVVKKRLVIK